MAQYTVCASVQTTHTYTFQLHPGRQDGSCRSLECKGNRGKNMFLFPAWGNECVAPFTTQKLWAVFLLYFFFFDVAVKNDLSFKVALKGYLHNYCGNIWVFLKWCGLDSFPKNSWLIIVVTTSWPNREEEQKKKTELRP